MRLTDVIKTAVIGKQIQHGPSSYYITGLKMRGSGHISLIAEVSQKIGQNPEKPIGKRDIIPMIENLEDIKSNLTNRFFAYGANYYHFIDAFIGASGHLSFTAEIYTKSGKYQGKRKVIPLALDNFKEVDEISLFNFLKSHSESLVY
jgi:hypothetical protein